MNKDEYKDYLKLRGFSESEIDLVILSKSEYLKEYPRTVNYQAEFKEMLSLIELVGIKPFKYN